MPAQGAPQSDWLLSVLLCFGFYFWVLFGSSFVFLIRERNLLVLRCCVMFERCAKPRYPGLCFRMEEQWMCPS